MPSSFVRHAIPLAAVVGLVALHQPAPAHAEIKCSNPARVKFSQANFKYRDAAKIQRISFGQKDLATIKADLRAMNRTYFHETAKVPEFLDNIMPSGGNAILDLGQYEVYLLAEALHVTSKPFTDRGEPNNWLWTTNSPYYNFYDISYFRDPARPDGLTTMKCNDGGISLIGWYRHPTWGTGKVSDTSAEEDTLAALNADPTGVAANELYIASILDLKQEHLPALKRIQAQALEYAAKWGYEPSTDRVETYYHWPVGVDTVTLHMHLKINSLWSPVERMKSWKMDDLIAYLEDEATEWPQHEKGKVYKVGDQVHNGERYYSVKSISGDAKSAGGGNGPEGATVADIVDGNVTWTYQGPRKHIIDHVAERIYAEGGIYMRGNDGKQTLLDLGWTAAEHPNPYKTAYSRIKAIVLSKKGATASKDMFLIQFAGANPENDVDPPILATYTREELEGTKLKDMVGRKVTDPRGPLAKTFRAEDLEAIRTETAGTRTPTTGDTPILDFLACQFDYVPGVEFATDCYHRH